VANISATASKFGYLPELRMSSRIVWVGGGGPAGSGIFDAVDLSDLHIPLLRMTRIEVLMKFLAIDALLGHALVDRAEQLVLGVLEALPDPSWLEARSEVAIRRGCTICKLGGALQSG
jgi:hypothetical protein